MPKFWCFCGLLLLLLVNASAQTPAFNTDSAAATGRNFANDSLKAVPVKLSLADSLSLRYIAQPKPGTNSSPYLDSVIRSYAINPLYQTAARPHHTRQVPSGTPRNTRQAWLIWVALGLIVYAGFLNQIMHKDINALLSAFYSPRMLSKIEKDDTMLSSWAYIALFGLFGVTLGLFVYQVTDYYNVGYNLNDVEVWLLLSVMVLGLLIFKILSIKVIGFVFDINRMLNQYISVLYLTYFNIAFIFVPLVICLCLLPQFLAGYIIVGAMVLVLGIVAFQYLRTALSIVSNFRFQKIYLFIYLCALEICPILILIKALNF